MTKRLYQFTLVATVAILCAVALYFISVFAFWLFAEDKIYPGIKVAGNSLNGKTKSQAEALLNDKLEAYQRENINLSGTKSTMMPVKELEASCNIAAAVEEAYKLGRENPFFLGHHQDITTKCNFSLEKVLAKVGFKTTAAENSRLEKVGDGLKFNDGKSGKRINYSELSYRLEKALGNLELKVSLPEFEVEPTFTKNDFEENKDEILKKTATTLDLLDGNNVYSVEPKILTTWIGIGSNKNAEALNFSGDRLFEVFWGGRSNSSVFSYDAVSNFLVSLSEKINSAPQNAKLATSDGAVVVSVKEKDGRSLNITKSANSIIEKLDSAESTGKNQIKLTVDSVKADIRSDNLAELGLTDLLSVGYSTFTGSPANRQHNIRTGASKFNGVIIKPEESFSFIKTLGPVDASTGYLPELVIKENKTIPEYGGGMCQVSSTTFRAALNAGLPILERTPHSYPVSYYKPFGVDATVYIPKPDLVFKNDTGKYILMQTKIEGTKLSFEFYGTKPQRTIKFAGNDKAEGAVEIAEKLTPLITEAGLRGNGAFTATFWRFIYDKDGKLIVGSKFVSKYDSPDKYPH